MNVLELAMKMERDGEIFYRELAAKASTVGFREIFNQLADDEVKHYQHFQDLQSKQESFIETRVLKNAANIFRQIIAENSLNSLDESQLDLYQKAMELEKKSQTYYLEQAEAAADDTQKALLRMIAAEEGKHYFLLHNIYELVLHPQVWVENGEFVHLEEY